MLINTFNHHYRGKYGKSVGKIALDRGVPCPNRKTGGCIFCGPRSFRPYYQKKGEVLDEQIRKGKIFLKRKKFTYYFAYFQQETNTAAPYVELIHDFSKVLSDPLCVGVIISTRPDYLEDMLLDELNRIASEGFQQKEIIIELGLQSAHDSSLLWMNRNHTVADFVDAAERIKAREFIQLGVHLILGIPGEDFADMLHTLRFVLSVGVEHIKIHHLQVIEATELAKMYLQKPFPTFDVQGYMDLVSQLLLHVPGEVIMHRLWSMSEEGIIIAPRWELNNFEMGNLLREVLTKNGRWQGKMIS